MFNVEELIDMNITDFIEFVQEKNVSECMTLEKMFEIELSRVRQMREQISRLLTVRHSLVTSDALNNFLFTYVAERKILDRIDLVKYVKHFRNQSLDMSMKSEKI